MANSFFQDTSKVKVPFFSLGMSMILVGCQETYKEGDAFFLSSIMLSASNFIYSGINKLKDYGVLKKL